MNSPSTSLVYPPLGLPYMPTPQPVRFMPEEEREWLYRLPTFLNVGIRIEGSKIPQLRKSFADALEQRWKERKIPKQYRPFAIFWLFVVEGDTLTSRRGDREQDVEAAALAHDTLGTFAITERLVRAQDVPAEIQRILDQIEEQILDLHESIPASGI